MPVPEAIPVNAGFSWTAAGAWGTFITAALGLAGLVLKQIGPWRKQTTDAETKLREEMGATIARLEAKVDKLEKTRESERAKHEAERSIDRHRLNNLSQCLDTVFLMLEATPERVIEVVQKIREMRERQIAGEAIEKATLHAGEVASKAADVDQA